MHENDSMVYVIKNEVVALVLVVSIWWRLHSCHDESESGCLTCDKYFSDSFHGARLENLQLTCCLTPERVFKQR